MVQMQEASSFDSMLQVARKTLEVAREISDEKVAQDECRINVRLQDLSTRVMDIIKCENYFPDNKRTSLERLE